jgi:hypothetical protein
LQEAIRWWDRWLKGDDNGIMGEPRSRVWMQEGVALQTFHAERPGRGRRGMAVAAHRSADSPLRARDG